MKKRPTKKAFFEYMSLKYDNKFKDQTAYDVLLDVIRQKIYLQFKFL